MADTRNMMWSARGLCLLLASVAGSGCATRFDAYRARFVDPQYVITRQFYEEAPQRVAVLPFVARSLKPIDQRKAEGCRRVFFQHLSLRDFEDVELRKFDRSISQAAQTNEASMLYQLMDVVRRVDVVGLTTVVDVDSLFTAENLQYADFAEMVRLTRDDMHADAYIMGITRDFGRLYAVLFSSVGISTRLEMRSARTGSLLWRTQGKKRNYQLPLTLNPLDIPRLFYDVWANSRGLAMDQLAYGVYGELTRTLPYVAQKGGLFVEGVEPRVPYYGRPGCWMTWSKGRAKEGQRLEFLREQNGWFECKAPNGKPVWIFRRHGRLVDGAGAPVDPHADLQW
jgi:hypothetical protein